MSYSISKLLFLLALFILNQSPLLHSRPLILVKQNELLIEKLDNERFDLKINFSFDENSFGLGHGQVIAIHSNQYISYNSKDITRCILKEKVSGKEYRNFEVYNDNNTENLIEQYKKSNQSTSKELSKTIANYIFCKNMSLESPYINKGNYQLIITNIYFHSRVISNISIFTATDYEENRVIIDNSPVTSSFILHNEPNNSEYSLFKAKFNFFSSNNQISHDGIFQIRPNEKFDMEISLQLNSGILESISEYMITLVQSKNTFRALDKLRNKIEIRRNNEPPIQNADFIIGKDGKLTFINIDDVFLTKNDSLKIKIYGISTLNQNNLIHLKTDMSSKNNNEIEPIFFEISVYNRNSFSLITRFKNYGLKIVPWEFSTNIYQTNLSNIYAGGAYQIKIEFNTPPDFVDSDDGVIYREINGEKKIDEMEDINEEQIQIENFKKSKGSFFVLQHVNAIKNMSEMTFIASTCDFSEFPDYSTNIENKNYLFSNFNNRPICHALRNDFLYPELVNNINALNGLDFYSGSGIYFRMDKILKNTKYKFSVWIYADVCGNSTFLNNSSDSPLYKDPNYEETRYLQNKTSNVNFFFKFSFYSKILPYKYNEEKFNSLYVISNGYKNDTLGVSNYFIIEICFYKIKSEMFQ